MASTADGREEIKTSIQLVDILDFVADSVRPIREGSCVFDAGHVICIGYTENTDSAISFTGFVRQSSNPGHVPHRIDLKITPQVSGWQCTCSCKAGTGRCKHIVACLLHLNRSGSAEYLTCTDNVQAWGISKVEKQASWGAKKISQLCCVNHPPKLESGDDAAKEQILAESFSRMLLVANNSAISKHRNGRHLNDPIVSVNRAGQSRVQEPETVEYCSEDELKHMLLQETLNTAVEAAPFETLPEKLYYDKNVYMNMDKIVHVAMDTKDQSTNYWKIQRTVRITASGCYGLYTYLFNENPDWNRKISQYWSMRNINTTAIKYGKSTEAKAFRCYKNKRNPNVKKCGLTIKPEECWFAASPDGVDPIGNVILEIKCPTVGETGSVEDIRNCETVKKYIKYCTERDIWKLNEKHTYYCQVQLCMWVFGTTKCDFILYSLKDDDFLLIEVLYDLEFVENVVNGLKGLYFSKMLVHLLPKSN